MSPEEFYQVMMELAGVKSYRGWYNPRDKEGVHVAMDDLMLRVLRELGYGKGCDIFDQTEKWYA